jgi:hypothetical protein
MRIYMSVVPQHSETELLPTPMVDQTILVFVPWFRYTKRILEPGLLGEDGLEEEFAAGDAEGERAGDEGDGILTIAG